MTSWLIVQLVYHEDKAYLMLYIVPKRKQTLKVRCINNLRSQATHSWPALADKPVNLSEWIVIMTEGSMTQEFANLSVASLFGDWI